MTFGELATAVGASFTMLCAYLALSASRRSEAHVWIENVLLIGIFCYAVYVLFSFWTEAGPPSRGAILLAIFHTLMLTWAPKSIVDGYFHRREMARAIARNAMMEDYLKKSEARLEISRTVPPANRSS